MRRLGLLLVVCGVAAGCDAGGDCPGGASQFRRVQASQTEIWCARADGTADGPYTLEGAGVVSGAFRDGLADGRWTYRGVGGGIDRDEGFDLGRPHGEWTARDTGQAEGLLLYRHFFRFGVPCGAWEEQGATGLAVTHDYGTCEGEAPPVTPMAGKPAPAVAPEWPLGLTCPGGAVLAAADPLDAGLMACVDAEDARVFDGPWQRRTVQRVVAEGRYARGEKTGTWRTWFATQADGARWATPGEGLASVTEYVDGREQGEAFTWRADGSAAAVEVWAAGVRSGAARTWYATGAPEWTGAFKGGRRDGVWTRQYATGVTALSETWADGGLAGAAATYFESGAVESEGQYAAGVRTGVWKTWYAWGPQATEGTWVGGVEDGPFASYTAAGTPDASGQYAGGLATGEWTFWSDVDGVRVRERGQFVDGAQEGLWVATLPDGSKLSETHYAEGLREGGYTAWFGTGETAIDGSYLDDLAHGRWRLWDESGVLLSDCWYVRGAKHGLCLRWWESGEKRSEIQFVYGRWESGGAHCWDEQGTARECVLGEEL
jgi:antitoxin component YwqK of YwqJK toxin-antitoxin module